MTLWYIREGEAYDSFSSCSPEATRIGRARTLHGIPCDLSKHNYCHLPGSTYPWHAVRQFVHENQGLMRRMYGDQRHIAVLQAEIDDNTINIEPASKEYWSSNSRYLRQEVKRKPSGKNLLNLKYTNEIFTMPHFRPTTYSSIVKTEKGEHYETDNNKTGSALNSSETLYDFQPIDVKIENLLKTGENSNSIYSNASEIVDDDDDDEESLTMIPTPLVEDNDMTTEYETILDNESEEIHLLSDSLPGDQINEEPVTDKENKKETTGYFTVTKAAEKEDNKVKIINEKIANIYKTTTVLQNKELSGTELFQDTTAQESAPPIMKIRGVNACPVKEEVVAPFWANNTRGEVLALLNLYPFEQYVHWEKCSHEQKQMFCRQGCRCEQQYRLHRLLAYDPQNECRGIFSDWFRFPSCCVCKCYNVPSEFRVTSRSPRVSSTKQTVIKNLNDEAEDIIRKQLYKQAARRWYNPMNED
ncbi:protein spaetzle 4 isoform X2 [Ctenocephalides felis]|nr:protein spaetzle 4 isoform X2 [Ctenocephalides felis]